MNTQTIEKLQVANPNAEAEIRRLATPRPRKPKAKIFESPEMLGLEYSRGSVLRNEKAYRIFAPAICSVLIGSLLLMFAAGMFFGGIGLAVVGIGAITRLARSTVHVAITDQMMLIEEHSIFFNESLEIPVEDISFVLLLGLRSKYEVTWEIRIYRQDETFYTLPRAGSEELNWLSFEICERMNITRQVSEKDK